MPGSVLVPTGSVTLYDGATEVATVPLDSSGTATWVPDGLRVGKHNLSAIYAGDANFNSSVSEQMTIVVAFVP